MQQQRAKVIYALKAGEPAVFPTDTVYGLGVAVRYAPSPQAVFQLKQRAANKPIAWLIESPSHLLRYGSNVSAEALELAREGWPGALTLIVQASSEVPPAYQSQEGTIGLRVPNDEITQALIREVGPLATSSANVSGQPAPCCFEDISPQILHEVAALAGTPCEASGTASKVIDCTGPAPRVLRA